MRISDWSSDVCSSDLSARSWARASRGAACAFRCRRSSRSGFLDEGDMIGAPGAGPDLGARRAQPADLAEGDVAGDEQRPVAGILAGRRGGPEHAVPAKADRKSLVYGTRVSLRVYPGGRPTNKQTVSKHSI